MTYELSSLMRGFIIKANLNQEDAEYIQLGFQGSTEDAFSTFTVKSHRILMGLTLKH